MTGPATVPRRAPLGRRVRVPVVSARGGPPPLMPGSWGPRTAAPVTGVIESKTMRLPPSWARPVDAPAANRPSVKMEANSNLAKTLMANLLDNWLSSVVGGYRSGLRQFEGG